MFFPRSTTTLLRGQAMLRGGSGGCVLDSEEDCVVDLHGSCMDHACMCAWPCMHDV